MSRYGLLIDYKYCTGCHTCEVACRQEKGITDMQQWGIKITEHGPRKLNGKWFWDFVPVPSSLCDLCESRLEEGKKPACVHHCLALCMECVKLEDIAERVEALGGEGIGVFIPN